MLQSSQSGCLKFSLSPTIFFLSILDSNSLIKASCMYMMLLFHFRGQITSFDWCYYVQLDETPPKKHLDIIKEEKSFSDLGNSISFAGNRSNYHVSTSWMYTVLTMNGSCVMAQPVSYNIMYALRAHAFYACWLLHESMLMVSINKSRSVFKSTRK